MQLTLSFTKSAATATVAALLMSACGSADATGSAQPAAGAGDELTIEAAEPSVTEEVPAATGAGDAPRGEPLPAIASSAPRGRYASDQLGVPVAFTTPQDLYVAVDEPGMVFLVGNVEGHTGADLPTQSIVLGFRRWAGWSTAEEAVSDTPIASIDPLDVDAWLEATDVVVLADRTVDVGGREARVVDVTLDPDAGVALGEGSCLPGWAPCLYPGLAALGGERSPFVSAARTTRFYVVPVEGSAPILITAAAPPGHPWLDDVAESVIPSLQLGPDAPPPA